jgi:hypothetical protein
MPDYFTLVDFRAMPHMGDATKYPDVRAEASASHVVGVIEREVKTSFVARTRVEFYDGDGSNIIYLRHPFVLSVTSVEIDGVALSGYTYRTRGGLLRRYATGATTPTTWPVGFDNIEVTYEAGYSATPPDDIKEAALKATRAHMLATASASAMDDRRMSISTEAGTLQFSTAGSDRPTGYPDVDAVIVGWRNKLALYGFA